jgi:hypothetical protein
MSKEWADRSESSYLRDTMPTHGIKQGRRVQEVLKDMVGEKTKVY